MTDGEPEEAKTIDPVAKGCGLGCLGLLAVFVVLFVVGMVAGDDGDGDEVTAWDAERVCKEDFIPKRLKAPSTAEYDLTATGGPTTYTVTGTVDAENSFGAHLRSDVRCVVTVSGDRWRLDSLTGLN